MLSERLQENTKKKNIVRLLRGPSNINPRIPDHNLIIDPGCLRSGGEIASAAAFCDEMNL